MVSKKVIVTNETGLHARPAKDLVALCRTFGSTIFLSKGDKKVNASSIISVLTLGVKAGTEIEIIAEGEDEAKAVEEIAAFIEELED